MKSATGLRGRHVGWTGVAALMTLLVVAPSGAVAQDALLDALMLNRQLVRTAEVIEEIGPRAAAYPPVAIALERPRYGSFAPYMPELPLPRLEVKEQPPLPEVDLEDEPGEAAALGELRWRLIQSGADEEFRQHFAETLWTHASRAATPLDTMATPEVRARLHATFGPPTRSPVARARPQMQAGSEYVQFEYWFMVNDRIAFVVMDRDGPFGRGVVMIADDKYADVLAELEQDLVVRLMAHERLMPYVDYYQSREDGQWYRTGFDGEEYYITETERPRWARRGQQRGRWYDFR